MTDKKNQPDTAVELRRQAEEKLRQEGPLVPESLLGLSPEEISQNLHELRVHQIELEMQNEELRRTQEELGDSRARYFDLYDLAPVGYVTINEKGLILETNLTAATLLCKTRNELAKQPVSNFILKEDQDIYYRHQKQLFETGEPQIYELRMVRPEEPPFWARLDATAAQDKDGRLTCRVVIVDITERKEAENRLHKYSHDIAERVKELNCLHEISTLIEEKDISFVKLLQGIVDLIPPAWQYPEITCARLIMNEQEYKTENFQKTKWCQHSDIFVHGEHLGVLEVFHLERKLTLDEGPFLKEERNLINAIAERLGRITERKQNERDTQAIMESTVGKIGQNLFDFIVVKLCEWLRCDCAIIGEISNDGTVKARAMILDGNPVSDYRYNLKGSPCAETTRKCYCIYSENVSNLFPDDPCLIEMDAEGYVGISLKGKNGKAIGILCGISRKKLYLTKQTQNVMKIIGTRISTELERIQIESEKTVLEAHIQQSQKMESIGTLAGGIAHDFNNILFPIVGHTEMLLEDVATDSPFRLSIEEIYTSSLRAKDLVKQILTFSRQEKIELKLMKMQPIIKEALKLIRSTIPTTIEIKQDISPACDVIKADPTQIHQIVMNLATNAYHAMEETGGELKVGLKQMELGTCDLINPDMTPGQYACITVADTGTGMDKELTQKIFDPFFTTKAVGKGTGMGLSVVHGIVAGMGGAIRVYGEPGKGTEFYVCFPVGKSSFEKHSVQTHEAIQSGIERILLVDDEDAIITMEKLMLERLGYQVTSRTSSIEALETFRDSPDKFDIVITDMAMPNMSGDKLSVELTKIRPDIPVLLCTGFSETMSEEKADSLGIKGFLLKPIVMNDLAQKIREVLDREKSKLLNIKAFIDKPIPMKDLAEKVRQPLNQSKSLIMKKILIIDDDVSVRKILIKLLERNEYTVIAASNGDQGIQLFKDHHPDLVITDIIMPEKEGLETIGELKELNSDVKIIAMSGGGFGDPGMYLDLASSFGAVRTFLKPINNNALLSTIKDLIA